MATFNAVSFRFMWFLVDLNFLHLCKSQCESHNGSVCSLIFGENKLRLYNNRTNTTEDGSVHIYSSACGGWYAAASVLS